MRSKKFAALFLFALCLPAVLFSQDSGTRTEDLKRNISGLLTDISGELNSLEESTRLWKEKSQIAAAELQTVKADLQTVRQNLTESELSFRTVQEKLILQQELYSGLETDYSSLNALYQKSLQSSKRKNYLMAALAITAAVFAGIAITD